MTFVKTIEVSCFKDARVPDVFFFDGQEPSKRSPVFEFSICAKKNMATSLVSLCSLLKENEKKGICEAIGKEF